MIHIDHYYNFKKKGKYLAILTEKDWSVKDLLYSFKILLWHESRMIYLILSTGKYCQLWRCTSAVFCDDIAKSYNLCKPAPRNSFLSGVKVEFFQKAGIEHRMSFIWPKGPVSDMIDMIVLLTQRS